MITSHAQAARKAAPPAHKASTAPAPSAAPAVESRAPVGRLYSASGGVETPGAPALPGQDLRFMLNLGPGVFRWK